MDRDNTKYRQTGEKVYLLVKPSNVTREPQCLVFRPNLGKRIMTQPPRGTFVRDIESAEKIWKKEFKLADIPSDEFYQYSCPGRHSKKTILAGAVVPMIQSITKILNIRQADTSNRGLRMPNGKWVYGGKYIESFWCQYM